MSTRKQKTVARKNLAKARAAGPGRKKAAKSTKGTALSTADKNRLPTKAFAFPDERKEPLIDAKHVRNAVSRFDQVEGVSDAERDRAWKRIQTAAKEFDVEIEATSWRDLGKADGSGTGKKKTEKPAKKKGKKKKDEASKGKKGTKAKKSKNSKKAKKK